MYLAIVVFLVLWSVWVLMAMLVLNVTYSFVVGNRGIIELLEIPDA